MAFESGAYAKRTLDFIDRRREASDDISRDITEEVKWYGFSHVSVWSMPGPGENLPTASCSTPGHKVISTVTSRRTT